MAPRARVFLFLLFQALIIPSIVTLKIPLTNPHSLLNYTVKPTTSTPPAALIAQIATLPSLPHNTIDYHILGTSLVLHITKIRQIFSEYAANEILDAAIYRVILKINAGYGKEEIDFGIFEQRSSDHFLRIGVLEDAEFNYFMLGMQFSSRNCTDCCTKQGSSCLARMMIIFQVLEIPFRKIDRV